MIEEQELARSVLAGDSSAQEVFARVYRPQLLRTSMYFLGPLDAKAEEVTRQTLVLAERHLDLYDDSRPLMAFLRQICLRLCYACLAQERGKTGAAEDGRLRSWRRVRAEIVDGRAPLRLAGDEDGSELTVAAP